MRLCWQVTFLTMVTVREIDAAEQRRDEDSWRKNRVGGGLASGVSKLLTIQPRVQTGVRPVTPAVEPCGAGPRTTDLRGAWHFRLVRNVR